MEPADDFDDADPGLARERTHLAWTRTVIALAAVCAAILRSHAVAGIPVLLLTAVVWNLGRRPEPSGGGHARARRLFMIAVAVGAIAVAALGMSFLGHGPGLVFKRP